MLGAQIKVFIADDEPVVHEGLARVLESDLRFEIVGHAENLEFSLVGVKACNPDVIYLDLSLPDISALDSIPLFKTASPEGAVVVFSMFGKTSLVQRAFRLGARGYVLKRAPTNEIAEATLAVHQGRYYLSSQIVDRVIRNFVDLCQTGMPVSKYDFLSEREQQVFRLMVEGLTTRQIAKNIFLSPKTIEKHRSSLIKKLGIQDIVGMVKYAIEIGVIDPYSWPRQAPSSAPSMGNYPSQKMGMRPQ